MASPPKEQKALKALSEGVYLDLSKISIEKIVVGSDEIFGSCIHSVMPPGKGSPFWEIRYEVGSGMQVLYAASTPIQIYAVEIKQEQTEEVVDDDE